MKVKYRYIFVNIVISLLISGTAVFGNASVKTGYFEVTFAKLLLRTVIWCIPVSFLLWIILYLLEVINRSEKLFCRLSRLTPDYSKKSILIFTAILFFAWGIYIIAFYPGTMNYDTWYQMYQSFPENHPIEVIFGVFIKEYYCDHHPIFDTLLFSFFAKTSDYLFGYSNYGIFLYVLIQSVITAFTYTFAFAYLKKKKAPTLLLFIAYWSVALVPIWPINSITMLKDTLFSLIFVWYFLEVIEIVQTRSQWLNNRKHLIAYIITCVLLCLTKKTGIYQVLVLNLFILIFLKKVKQIIISSVFPMLMMWIIIPYIVYPVFDVLPGGKQDMLSVPFQQTAAYVVEWENELSDEEIHIIDNVLNYDTLKERYNPLTVDPVKNAWRYETVTKEDMHNYYKLWIKEGLKHPVTYVKASAPIMLGYLSADTRVYLHMTQAKEVWANIEARPYSGFPERLKPLREKVSNIISGFSNSHIGKIYFTLAVYSWWLPLIGAWVIFVRNPRKLLVFVAEGMCLVGCLIGPVISSRYAYPMIYVAPILMCYIGIRGKSIKKIIVHGKEEKLTNLKKMI